MTRPNSHSEFQAVLFYFYFPEDVDLAASSLVTISGATDQSLGALPQDVEAASLATLHAPLITNTAIQPGSVDWARQCRVL